MHSCPPAVDSLLINATIHIDHLVKATMNHNLFAIFNMHTNPYECIRYDYDKFIMMSISVLMIPHQLMVNVR